MPVTYTNAVKIARMGAVTSQAGATAVLEIGTAAMGTVLASFALNNPIAGAATGEPADPARVAAGGAEPVADAAALETVAGNYEACREYIDQLRGWQRWWGEVSR